MRCCDVIRYFPVMLLIIVVGLSLGACNNIGELADERSDGFSGLTTATPGGIAQTGPTPTRRPVPTLFPTEEPARPRSESLEPVATVVDISDEEQAALALEMIKTAHRSGLTVDGVRATIIYDNLTAGDSEALLLEFVRPSSFRMVTDELDLIVTAGQTYSKDETATWLVSPVEMMDRFDGLFENFINEQYVEARLEELSANIIDVHLIGEESLNGIAVLVFNYSEQPVEDEAPVHTSLWIGAEDGLLYRQVTAHNFDNFEHQITTDFEYSDTVRINPPVP